MDANKQSNQLIIILRNSSMQVLHTVPNSTLVSEVPVSSIQLNAAP
ncbi:unnamed protein product [Chironomus riparius]|uniref:Uncharacterized protein n=1 Tax=Chironomus riparius TaxID=315576 RepID=A0A9N9WPA8_9DIPT|nr:unnamed protein product [Chironomus riparius]